MLKRSSLLFTAGAIGGVATVVLFYVRGALGLGGPPVSLGLLYKQMVWGGLWGLVLLVPLFAGRWWLKGLIVGFLAGLAALVIFLPMNGVPVAKLGPGFWATVLLANAIVFGLVTAWWAKLTGSIDADET